MKAFIDEHRVHLGSEPICKVLQVASFAYRHHAAGQQNPELRCARSRQGEVLIGEIERVWQANLRVYGADKVWLQLNREGVEVARCALERLMRQQGLCGAVRGRPVRTTRPNPAVRYPLDRVNRQFAAKQPNQLWFSDFTDVSTWQGLCLCRLRHRCLCPLHRGPARQSEHAYRFRRGCLRTSLVC